MPDFGAALVAHRLLKGSLVNDDCRPQGLPRPMLATGIGIKQPRVRRFEQSSGPLSAKARASLISRSGVTASFCAADKRATGFVAHADGEDFHSIGARLRSIRRASTLSRKGN